MSGSLFCWWRAGVCQPHSPTHLEVGGYDANLQRRLAALLSFKKGQWLEHRELSRA